MGPLKHRYSPSHITPRDFLTTPLFICLPHARSHAQHSPHMICMDLQHKLEIGRLVSPIFQMKKQGSLINDLSQLMQKQSGKALG